jgi:hypothetical protein
LLVAVAVAVQAVAVAAAVREDTEMALLLF